MVKLFLYFTSHMLRVPEPAGIKRYHVIKFSMTEIGINPQE
jgi:hypothetical protein